MEKYLSDIYLGKGQGPSFSGIDKLYQYVKKDGKYKISRKKIQEWLSKQDGYSLQRQVVRNFKRPNVVVSGIDTQWDADTAILKDHKEENKGFGYFLLVIDIFSRYVWTRPLKSKFGNEMVKNFKTIFDEGRRPYVIRTDKGGEFVNKKMNSFLQAARVKYFVTENEVKANFAERAIKTIKSRLIRYMTTKNTFKWIDQLQPITLSYNNTFHRSIGMSPMEVNKGNESELWKKQYPNITEKVKPVKSRKIKPEQKKTKGIPKRNVFKFKISDIVRITHLRKLFEREYNERWTREVFTITDKKLKQNIPTYNLKDYNNEEISGIFYEHELQKIIPDKNKTYEIEKILKHRKRNGKKEVLVRWLGWPSKFDSWLVKGSLKKI